MLQLKEESSFYQDNVNEAQKRYLEWENPYTKRTIIMSFSNKGHHLIVKYFLKHKWEI